MIILFKSVVSLTMNRKVEVSNLIVGKNCECLNFFLLSSRYSQLDCVNKTLILDKRCIKERQYIIEENGGVVKR